MIPDLSLCRFAGADKKARFGLISGGKLYDLSELRRPALSGMEAWLKYASGRVAEAIDELAALPAKNAPCCQAEALLDASGPPSLLAPLDTQEVWACGVTYEMSREARMRESAEPTIYGRVYDAPRPEIFFKATPHRVVGPGDAVAIRADSRWDVPEPEMTLVINPQMEIVGYTVGNDMSSRDIEGQNPLYLPQAKIYERCCALGPFVKLASDGFDPLDQSVKCVIYRDGEPAFEGETHTSKIHRPLADMARYLGRCNSLPTGAFMLTGTGIVPPDTFTLREGDVVEITFEGLGTLSNPVIVLKVDP